MENLPKNILVKIALDLSNLSDIINLCLTSSIINEKVGLNQMFWMKKLSNDYDIYNKTIPEKYRLKDARFDYKKYFLYIDYMLKKYPYPNNLLKIGSIAGELNLVKISLKKGANIHTQDDYALRWASCNGQLEVVKLLIKEGANIHDEALKYPRYYGHLEVVEFLIEILQKRTN